jgi:hypothetical protein
MPYKLQIIKTNDFLCLDGKGKVDLDKSLEVLARLAKACEDKDVTCALLDVREMYSDMSLNDLYSLVKSFRSMGFRPDLQLAVLNRYGSQMERGENFATFASDQGWNVRSFENFEEAIDWFSSVHPLVEETCPKP